MLLHSCWNIKIINLSSDKYEFVDGAVTQVPTCHTSIIVFLFLW